MGEPTRIKITNEYWDEYLECMPREQLNQQRALMMHKHLRYTYQNSTYYKNLFHRIGLNPETVVRMEDFQSRVPLTRQEEIIANQVDSPPFGDFLALNLKHVTRIYSSPGPLMMPFSKEDMDSYINTTANGLYICGARRGDIADITYAYQWDLAGTMLDEGFRRLGCAVVPGGPGMSETHALVMKHLGVTILRVFPSFAFKLADTARRMGIDPAGDLKVRLLIIGGEIIDEEEKARLAKVFDAEVREMYGWAETGFVAAQCREGGGMHCFSHNIVEVIDPDSGEPVGPDKRGEVVVTDVSRRAMPLIRYRTGDITAGLTYEPCPCGRTSPRLQGIVDHTGDTLHIRGVHVTPRMVEDVVRQQKSIGRYQIIAEKEGFGERFVLRVELEWQEDRNAIAKKLKEQIRIATRLRVVVEFAPRGSIREGGPIIIDKRHE